MLVIILQINLNKTCIIIKNVRRRGRVRKRLIDPKVRLLLSLKVVALIEEIDHVPGSSILFIYLW